MNLFSYKSPLFLCISLFLCLTINAQLIQTKDAESLAKAATKATIKNPWAVFNNPSNIAGLQAVEIGVNHSMPFNLEEFSTQSIAFVIPIKKSGLGFGHQLFGYTFYKEQITAFSYGIVIGENVNMGIGLYRYAISIGNGYGKKATISSNFGLSAKLSKTSEFYFMVQNIANSSSENYKINRPGMSQSIGLKITIGDQLNAILEIEKIQEISILWKSSLNYNVSKLIDLYFGLAVVPNSPSFGAKIKGQKLNFTVGMNYEVVFGFRTGLSMVYIFQKR